MTEDSPPSFAASVQASDASLPPEYDGHRNPTTLNHPPQLRTRLSERVYSLDTSKNQPWAFLKVNCRGGSGTSIPSFVQGEFVTGTVELSLEKTENIQAVMIDLRGETLEVGQEPFVFFTQETILWSTSMGDPGTSDSVNGSSKLKGQYVWPFSMQLPDKVTVPAVDKGPAYEGSPPPSFSERPSPAYIEYKIVVTFKRGRFRVDNTLSTSFGFLPRSTPPAPSALRQLAYRENTTPPGPKADPEGWEVFHPKSVVGTVFDSRQVEVSFLLALAKPLCYTRGSSIPFALTLSCSDSQALDLFAARGSLQLRLVRTLYLGSEATDETKARRSNNTFTGNVGLGSYWLSSENNPESDSRTLEGEISVKRDLKPSFTFPRMVIKYHVTLPLEAPGFAVLPENKTTLSREVVIATAAAPGPPPRSRLSPTQEGNNTGDYDVSIGMLTGANQRFLHHHMFG